MRLAGLLLAAPVAMLLVACNSQPDPRSQPDPAQAAGGNQTQIDPHSFALSQHAQTRHLSLDLTVDFARRVLEGTATLELDGHAPQLTLDTRDLVISDVSAAGVSLDWDLGEVRVPWGSPWSSRLPTPWTA